MKKWIVLPLGLLVIGCGTGSIEDDLYDPFDESQALAADDGTPKWETGTVPDSPTGTHQWLIRQAMRLLEANGDSAAANTPLGLFKDPACQKQIIQGVFDSDWLARYTGASQDLTPDMDMIAQVLSGANYAAHFYEPVTGTNWLGQKSPTAKQFVLDNLENARKAQKSGDRALACHELGVALHFAGDITQPMHTALFTAISFPFKLHSDLEVYASTLHEKHTVNALSAPLQTPEDTGALLDKVARASKNLWRETQSAITRAYRRTHCRTNWIFDNPTCWQGDAQVDKQIGMALRRAQEDLARILHSINLQ